MSNSLLRKSYTFIRKARFKRKLHMYKMAFGVMIDKTIAIYLLIIGGYGFISLFIFSDIINDYSELFLMIESQVEARFWLVVIALPLRYIIQSFSKPGIIFSSAEYVLSQLPYERKKIWLLSAIEEKLKRVCLYSFIGLVIIILTPIASGLIIQYLLLFLLIDWLMTIPQWKLYQSSIFVKVGWFLLMVGVIVSSSFMQGPIISTLFIGLLIVMNFSLLRKLFVKIDWGKVTEVSDFQIWTVGIAARASGVSIKREKRYNVFRNLAIWSKPFEYTDKAIHQRIWSSYLAKNIQVLIQVIGVLFIMLFVFMFISNILFYIGIAVAIHVYTTLLSNLFMNRFQADILHVLPWDLPSYEKTFFKWAVLGTVILLVPVSVFLVIHATFWIPLQLLFYMSVFLYSYHVKLDKVIGMLGKEKISLNFEEGSCFLFLIGVGFSGNYPVIAVSCLLIFLLLKCRRGKLDLIT